MTTKVNFSEVSVEQRFKYDGALFQRLSLELSENGQSGLAWELVKGRRYKEWAIGLDEKVELLN